MKTLAVMCIAFTRQSPSRTPLSFTAASTCGVMLTKSILAGTLNVRVLRWLFMRAGAERPRRPSGPDGLPDARDLREVIRGVRVEIERDVADPHPARLERHDRGRHALQQRDRL